YASTTGYAWNSTATTSTIPPFGFHFNPYNLSSGVFGDVNGDGLPDYEAYLSGYISPTAYLGNGRDWDVSTFFTPAQSFPVTGFTATSSQLVDVNGDGLDDWVYSDATKTYVLLNTGTGWGTSPDTQWTIATSTLYKDVATGNYYDRGIR